MGKPSQLIIKKNADDIPASFKKLLTARPLPDDEPLFQLKPEFIQMVKRVLDHIEKNGTKSQGGMISALIMTYFLEYGNNLGTFQSVGKTKTNRLVAAGTEDFALLMDGKAYSIDFDQLQELLGWLTKNADYVPTIKKWIK